ncbi:VCBS domain-containing protein, partial [Shewanella colwelliana]|uniref:VCBS domain-containing protein n=1 Tax=Shewanella colwelliana TaxID=23 RepID=UPI001C7CA3DB
YQGQLRVDGALTATDADSGEAQFNAESLQGQFGTLSIDSNGHWTYTADNSQAVIQGLKSGDSLTDTVLVHSVDGTEQKVTVTINGTDDKAIISGLDTGDINESSRPDRSPDHAQPGMGEITNDLLYADGKLTIVDPDAGDNTFDSKGPGYNYHGQYGHLMLLEDGTWHYTVEVGQQASGVGSTIDKLGENETLTDTITIQSKDGTAHDIVITIHGDNDRPYCSSEVVLNSGHEDTAQVLTLSQLLQNTIDVDANDLGKLSIDNLHADHGSIASNPDGSFTFTPEKDYNGPVHFNYDVKDAHGGVTHTGASLDLAAVDDAAIITGQSTGDVDEGYGTFGDRSPDYAQTGMAKIGQDVLTADGKLDIIDPDTGESLFDPKGRGWNNSYHGKYGHLLLNTDGTWHYIVPVGSVDWVNNRKTAIGTTIDKLGEGQSLTDTITVHSKDGTTHDIVITIHGSNDRPYCSSEVMLANGSEDTRQTLTTAQLLANTVDVDKNDAGLLTIENLHADHGSILINGDGTFTFTPEKDYNGDVHFSYDVKDAHGGVTHTGATTNLAAVNDNPDVTPLTDSVTEGTDNHHTINLLLGATDEEGDALTISHLEYAIDGQPQSGQLPTGITLGADGHTLIVDSTDAAFNHLAKGQSQKVAITYQVEDGHGGSTQQTATLTIAGTDDKATLVSNVIQLTETQALDSEFKSYRGQLQLIDPDSGDNTQFVFSGKYLGQGFEPGHLDVWPNGTYQFSLNAGTNRHADDLISSLHAGESMELPYEVETSDGQKLTIMVKVTGEDNQAKIAVTPYSSLNNHVYEDHTSFGNTTNQLSSGGTLNVIDPDHDQAGFIAQTITTAEGGRFNINAQGHWSYNIDNDKVQHLGAGESFQQTFTVESIDGSAQQNITVTVHGTNDAPIASTEVRLAAGVEDNNIVLTPAQLLANTTDIDDNDIGKLSIENLQADHGSIASNADGTFTFTPEKDYNGDVHFSYNVKDAHGGITHTGATTSLAAVDDHTVFGGITTAVAKEDVDPGVSSYGNFGGNSYSMSQWHQLTITDTDNKVDHVNIEFGGNTYSWQVGSPIDIDTQYGKFELITVASGAHKGELAWLYNGDNTNTSIQGLKEGESLHESITLVAPDGTRQSLSVEIKGTEDHVIIDSPNHIGDVIEHQSTGAQVSGQLQAHDSDTHDSVSWAITQTTGKYGAFSIDANGQWHYIVDESKAGALGQGDEWNEHFTIEALSTDGSKVSKTVSVAVHGSNDAPTVTSGLVLTQANEDTQVILTQQDLLAHASDADNNDRGWLRVHNLTADHGTISTNTDGSFTFTPEKDYNGDVHFTYDVIDRHGGATHTDATINLVAVNDASVLASALSSNEVVEDHLSRPASHTLTSYWKNLDITDTDGQADAQIVKIEVNGVEHNVPANFTMTLQGAHGSFVTTHAGDGHNKWLYIANNNHAEIQQLKDGQTLTDSMTLITADGSRIPITATIRGTEDSVIIDTPDSLTASIGTAIEDQKTSLSGTLQAHDVDKDDSVHFEARTLAGNFGTFSVKRDGSWHYDVDPSKADRLVAGQNQAEGFDIVAISSDGSTATKHFQINVQGSNDAAIITGVDTGDVSENTAGKDMSPDQAHAGMGHLTGAMLYADGKLNITDLDTGENEFDTNQVGTQGYTYHGSYGRLILNADGNWHYNVNAGSRHNGAMPGTAGTAIDKLGDGQSLTDTITIRSKDGTTHDIVITIHGSNDRPYCSSEVVLANGSEDTRQTLTTAQLLANTVDVDANDVGKLTIENLQSDHGSILINGDGTFTFTPEKNYNGAVHFTYDVKDAHGGITHTSASTTLAAVNDSALINGQSRASSNVDIFEDGATSRLTGQLTLTDVDSGENQFATISQLAGQYGELSLDADGHWTYNLNNNLAPTNGLVNGQVVTDTFTVTSPDGTASHTINVQIHGHDDTPSLSVNEGGAGKSLDLLGGLSSGIVSHMQFSTDGVHYTNQVPDGFMLASDGHTLQVDPAHNSYNHLANGVALKVDIKYELQQGAGSNVQTSQQQAQVVVTGTSDRPIIHSFNPHSQQNNGPVTGNLLQGATDVDDGAQLVLHDVQFQDPVTHHYITVQAGQTHNITGVGVIAISANGDYTFTPNSQFSGQVPNLIYRVSDTNGDYADNSQNNLTIHIDPYQAPIIIAPLAVSLAHDTGSSATDLITQDGALSISGQTAGMQVEYSTDGGAHWSSQFTPVEGLNQLQVRQTDSAGHASKATSIDFTLDTNIAAPHISLDPITADDVLNQAELSGSVPVTGTVGSEVSVGDNITLTLGTHTYTGAVDAQHRFSIDIPANQLSNHSNISASVTIKDTAGNNATAADNHHYSTDTNAAIRVNLITSDNIIDASEHQQAIDITGTVSGVEDGQTVTVTIAGQQHQAVVTQGAWHTSLTAAEVQALPGGTVDITASVQDLAGNLASIHSPLFISDSANPVPTLSFKTPPTPTGSGSIGSHISGDLIAPPLMQQLSPTLGSGGWAITDGHGHTSTSLHGQYGTLTIDPATGHVDYLFSQAPKVSGKDAGGTHRAGEKISEEHHDIFQVVYHDAHASNVDVKVNLDVTYIHGRSGQNQSTTQLVGMTVTPDTSMAPSPSHAAPVMHDAPQNDEVTRVTIDDLDLSGDTIDHQADSPAVAKAETETDAEVAHAALPLPAAPVDHYLHMVGLTQGDITSPTDTPMMAALPDVTTLASHDVDSDMLDTLTHDHFDNPLADDEDSHKGEHAVIIDDPMDDVDHQLNDDELLHNALNDMHNQT